MPGPRKRAQRLGAPWAVTQDAGSIQLAEGTMTVLAVRLAPSCFVVLCVGDLAHCSDVYQADVSS